MQANYALNMVWDYLWQARDIFGIGILLVFPFYKELILRENFLNVIVLKQK